MRHFLLLFCLTFCVAAHAETPWVNSDDVRVTRLDEGFRVEVRMQAPVPPLLAWQVLTDFGNMARFIPNLYTSRVLSSSGNVMRVEQVGTARFGPVSQKFTSVRDITLTPHKEILARQLSGTASHMESLMRLTPLAEGTQFDYRAEIVPGLALPPLVGPAFVRHEMAEQFSAMIGEMVRRAPASGRP